MRICVLFISFAEQYEAYNFTFFNVLKFLLLSQYFITVLGQGSILLPWLGEALITFTLLSLLDFQRLHFQRLQLPRHFPTRGFRACALGDRLEGGGLEARNALHCACVPCASAHDKRTVPRP